MKRRFTILQWAALALVALLVSGCRSDSAGSGAVPIPTPTASGSLTDPWGMVQAGQITALGTLHPTQTLQLGFLAAGPVRAVPVRVGAQVQAGDLLAALDTTALEIELQSAQQEVAIRQAELDALLDGPNTSAATALVRRAETEHTQQVAEAEIALQIAERELERARLQDHAPSITIARSRGQQLDRQLAQARAQDAMAEISSAQIELERAGATLDETQDEYNKALDRPWEEQHVRDGWAKRLRQAQWDYRLAQAHLEAAQKAQRAHTLGVEALAVQGVEAEAQLGETLNAQAAYSLTLSLLTAQVDLARLRLEGLRAWENPHLDPRPSEQVAQSEARLRQAGLAVAKLEWELHGSELCAPFDGIVSATHLQPGEWADPGIPVIELLDTTLWHVETRNIGELNIGRVRVGQEAVVQVIAFRDQKLRGHVAAISPTAIVQQGDTTYSVYVELAPTDLSLRPGMNAEVQILTQ